MAHYQAVVRNKLGGIVPGANVSIFDAGTTTLADLFSDEALTVSTENPTQSDDSGKVDVYVVAGEYDVLIQRFDIEDVRFDDVSIIETAPTGFSPKYLTAQLSGNQTGNLASGNHIEFDTKGSDSGHITLSTGAGQANGIFTIPAGVWFIQWEVSVSFTVSTGVFQTELRDDFDDSTVGHGKSTSHRPISSSSNGAGITIHSDILVLSSATDVKVEINSSTGPNLVASGFTNISIFALS